MRPVAAVTLSVAPRPKSEAAARVKDAPSGEKSVLGGAEEVSGLGADMRPREKEGSEAAREVSEESDEDWPGM